MHNLGLYYEDGKGLKQDYEESLRWYRRAADLGNTEAMTNLAILYKDGRGVEQDYSEAHRWWSGSSQTF